MIRHHVKVHCMMPNRNDRKNSRNFCQLLQQEVDQVFTYRSLRDLEMAVRFNMPQMLERYPVTGWVRPQNTQALHDEIDQLKAKWLNWNVMVELQKLIHS